MPATAPYSVFIIAAAEAPCVVAASLLGILPAARRAGWKGATRIVIPHLRASAHVGESERGIVVVDGARPGTCALVRAELAAQHVAFTTPHHVHDVFDGSAQGTLLWVLHRVKVHGGAPRAVRVASGKGAVGENAMDIGHLIRDSEAVTATR